MSGLLSELVAWGANQLTGSRLEVIRSNPQVIGPTPSVRVQVPPRFAWDEKRWTTVSDQEGVHLRGKYRALDRALNRWHKFDGYLHQQGSEISAYIADPPPEVRGHRHGACLQLVKSPWFRLHWRRQPKDLDGALLYVEQMLDESFNP